MSILKVNPESYSEVHSEDSIQNNWAAVYAKSEIDNHRDTAVIDHPDGSVTKAKLADEVNAIISKAEKDADTAVNTANTAVNTANTAVNTANAATATANTAVATADTAAAKSEAAQQRAISADTKSDAAVSSASVAVQKAESMQSDLSEHISDTNIHTSAEEKQILNNGITSAHQYADRAYSLAQDARLLAGSVDANLTEHISDTNIHTTAEEKQNLDARLTSVESGKADISFVEDTISEVNDNISEAVEAVAEKQYELIEEITLTEDTQTITRTQEPNNNAYKFKNILAIVKIQGTNEDGYILCDNRLNKKGLNPNGITTDGFYTWVNLRGIDGNTRIFVETKQENGLYRIYFNYPSPNSGSPDNSIRISNSSILAPDSYINKFILTKNPTFSVGTKISIYGVRA